MRRAAVALAAVTALSVPSAASAWTTLAGGVQNIVIPSMVVTHAGTELVSFETPTANTISVSRNRAAPKVVVSNDPVAGRTQLVQQPDGALQLYFPNAQGVARLTSSDDGNSWTGPVQTQSHDVGGIQGAAVAPDGTPLFSQDGTGFVNVFRGLNGEVSKNVFPRCCGYGESLAVDTMGLVQVAFFSNADPNGTFLYEPLGADLSPTGSTPLEPTASHSDRVPLVADRSGNTFMAWPPGYPTATAFTVVPFRGGQPAGDGVTFRMAFAGGDPHMALSVDAGDRLWAVFTGTGAVHAARSRSHGQHFGAAVTASVPGTAYQVSAVGLPGDPGAVDVIVNTGSTLIEQQLQPGLSVHLSKKTHKVGKKTITTWYAQALDDGFGRADGDVHDRRAHGARGRLGQGDGARGLREGCGAGLCKRRFPSALAGYHEIVAVTAGPKKLDARALRADFPIFQQQIHGKPLAFLDSAASSQKPRQMLEAMNDFYTTSYANVHRGVYELAERATAALENAREKVRAVLNAPDVREIVFVRNATEAINLVAYSWGLNNLGPGDDVVVSELEHHSNFVPWQYIAGRVGARLVTIPLTEEGELDLSSLGTIAREGDVKVVATNQVSNSLGTINPVDRLAAWAHEQGAIFVCDAAQSAPHVTVDVQALGVDFLAVSGHKMCGPSGVGALWGRAELLEKMEPFLTGGHMINSVRVEKTTWGELPHKFEAGTAPMAEAVGLGAAIDYLNAIGFDAIHEHEQELAAYALGRLADVPGITLYGPPADRRAGIVSFNIDGIHPHDVAQILDMQGVAIRAGHHCCQPLMQKLGVAATNRASFYLYTVPEEIDQLVDGLATVHKVFA